MMSSAEELRLRGNDAFKAQDFESAFNLYSSTLALAPSDAVLYCNRAAALISLKRLDEAMSDALTAISLNPKNMKAYFRKASVEQSKEQWRESYFTWKAAKEACGRDRQLEQQLVAAKKKWVSVMRTQPISSSIDASERLQLMTDTRERLSTVAYLWNRSSPAERKIQLGKLFTLIGGLNPPNIATIDDSSLIALPMEGYSDLPESRIPAFTTHFESLDADGKTAFMEAMWKSLSGVEQARALEDLRSLYEEASVTEEDKSYAAALAAHRAKQDLNDKYVQQAQEVD
jgi:tetratricopeptide (TPR) repeat protein